MPNHGHADTGSTRDIIERHIINIISRQRRHVNPNRNLKKLKAQYEGQRCRTSSGRTHGRGGRLHHPVG